MDRIQSLEVFVAVAEEGSFATAARRTGLSAPSVTRGINALEARLGTRLFTRTTRQVRLTEVGTMYLEDARTILMQLQAADDAASGAGGTPVGQLRVTAPTEFGRMFVLPIMMDFLDRYPDVAGDVLMVDRVVNMVEEGFDIAVRIGDLPASGLSAIRVGQVRRVICGSPGYFEKHGRPKSARDLQDHRIISASSVSPGTEWRFGPEMKEAVRVKPCLVVSSVAAAIQAARADWGLCRVLSYQIAPDVKAGTLQTVLEGCEPPPLPVHLLHAEGRRAAAKVRCFLDFAKPKLRAAPDLN